MKRKYTKTSINKMSKEELQLAIDRAEGVRTVYNRANKHELVIQFIRLLNEGKIA